MVGIVMKNCKDSKISNCKFVNCSVAMEITDSENIELIDNIVSESVLDNPETFIEFVNQSTKFQSEIYKAKKGNKKSITFLKVVLEKITVETVMIAFKLYLNSKGISI